MKPFALIAVSLQILIILTLPVLVPEPSPR